MANCSLCGRSLTNPASIAAGIGPICSGRSYKNRIMTRYGSILGGWINIEAWEKVNKPCFSCKLFNFPGKNQEEENENSYIIQMKGLAEQFPINSIGGFCKKLNALVDGNLIADQAKCGGKFYIMRKDKSELPESGLLLDRQGQLQLFDI